MIERADVLAGQAPDVRRADQPSGGEPGGPDAGGGDMEIAVTFGGPERLRDAVERLRSLLYAAQCGPGVLPGLLMSKS